MQKAYQSSRMELNKAMERGEEADHVTASGAGGTVVSEQGLLARPYNLRSRSGTSNGAAPGVDWRPFSAKLRRPVLRLQMRSMASTPDLEDQAMSTLMRMKTRSMKTVSRTSPTIILRPRRLINCWKGLPDDDPVLKGSSEGRRGAIFAFHSSARATRSRRESGDSTRLPASLPARLQGHELEKREN